MSTPTLSGASAPPVFVDAPLPEPALFGLYTAARVLDLTDPHGANGVEWLPYTCEPAQLWDLDCDPEAEPVEKDLDRSEGQADAGPFTVIGTFDCGPFGFTPAQGRERARQNLMLGEERAVEGAVWTRIVGPAATDLNGAGAVDVVAGMGLLEAALGAGYGGVGIIYAPRRAIPTLAAANQLRREGPAGGQRLETWLGTRVAAGTFPDTGPGSPGSSAGSGNAWLFATGLLTVWRAPVFDTPDSEQILDRPTNALISLAERVVVPALDPCVIAAVRVQIETQ